jgi:hypothetical protein
VIGSAMHQAGASALTQLLQLEPPDAEHLTALCLCGHRARFKEMRTKSLLSLSEKANFRRKDHSTCVRCLRQTGFKGR